MDDVATLLRDAASSPWIYALIFGFVLLDAFLPIVPSETAVITAGVFAATGETSLVGVIALATAGAVAGDHVSYLLGQACCDGMRRWRAPVPERATAFDRAPHALPRHGAQILITARFIPGGRTATTLLMGATRYPLRAFALYDAVAALAWGIYVALLGYLGGLAFEDDPWRAVLLGLAAGLGLSALTSVTRGVVSRTRRQRDDPISRATVGHGQGLRSDRYAARAIDG